MADIKQLLSLAEINELQVLSKKMGSTVDSLVAKVLKEFISANKPEQPQNNLFTRNRNPISRDLRPAIRNAEFVPVTQIVEGIEATSFIICFPSIDTIDDVSEPLWEQATGYKEAYDAVKQFVLDCEDFMTEEDYEAGFVIRADKPITEALNIKEFLLQGELDFKDEDPVDFGYEEDNDEDEE